MRNFVDSTVVPILALPRLAKRCVAVGIDCALCALTVWFAFYLRLGEWVWLSDQGWQAVILSIVLAIPIFFAFRLYHAIFRHFGWTGWISLVQAHMIYGLIYAGVFTAWGIDSIPRTIGLLQPPLLLIAIGASRAFGRYWLGGLYRDRLNRRHRRRVLIYGAGSAGRELADALRTTSFEVIGFIDDAQNLHGGLIAGKRIWSPDRLQDVIEQYGVVEVVLAVPSATRARRTEILLALRNLGVEVRTLPGIRDLAEGKVSISDVRPVSVEDLLGREAVAQDVALLREGHLADTVLVTGAGGSIGSELCRQILKLAPVKLLLLESSEYALYEIREELQNAARSIDTEIVALLGSVTDEARMRDVFARYRPATVLHAAAYKHVPLVETNVIEGLRNNVLGTWTCARLAAAHGVQRFVLVSTDKAVRPTNVMGASKRLSELVLQALHEAGSETCFTMVRFGNVLGSSGSVVPLFRRQIAAGGPVTVTHRDVIRYFMTIPEAAQLVLHAGALASGGEVFVLDMGEPVKIYNLAVRMIELAGLRVRQPETDDGDIDIAFTGMRPGEKLYEELLIGAEPIRTTHPRIMMASENFLPLAVLEPQLADLSRALLAQDSAEAIRILKQLVPEYQPAADRSAAVSAQAPTQLDADPSRVVALSTARTGRVRA